MKKLLIIFLLVLQGCTFCSLTQTEYKKTKKRLETAEPILCRPGIEYLNDCELTFID